jgi:two-component sensor histidine kinase/HAMP domain-containing protein
MRIGLKISMGFVAIAALVPVVGWLSARTHDAVRDEVGLLRDNSLQEFEAATDMVAALKATYGAAQELVAEGELARQRQHLSDESEKDISRAAIAIETRLETLASRLRESRRATEAALRLGRDTTSPTMVNEAAETVWLDELEVELALHRRRLDALIQLVQGDPQMAARLLEEDIEPQYREVLLPQIRRYREDARREVQVAVHNVESALTQSDRRNQLISVVACALAGVLGLLLARSIARPIEALAAAAGRLGDGGLDVRVPVAGGGEVGLLGESFNRMAERLEATMVSKSYVDDIFRSMGEILLVSDAADRIRTVNRAAEEQLGWREEELIGRSIHDIVQAADDSGALTVVTRSGTALPVACTPTALDAGGRLSGRVWVAQNILRQKTIEYELRQSVAEKEVLLREIHHRVKNNLQVICSLLQLQAADAGAGVVAQRLADSEQRVRTMALIHEQLYRSDDLARVDFRAYVDRLARNVLSASGASGAAIRLRIEVDTLPLDLDVAILCGLILNELLANAVRHAFPDRAGGEIEVRFQQADGRATLTVADDGVGLRGEHADVRHSLGLRLVEAFARQLGGETRLDGSTGTRVTVAFTLATGLPAAVHA